MMRREMIERLQRVRFANENILRVNRDREICPHGNGAFYPTHGWWCDTCFGWLQAVTCDLADMINDLETLESANGYIHRYSDNLWVFKIGGKPEGKWEKAHFLTPHCLTRADQILKS